MGKRNLYLTMAGVILLLVAACGGGGDGGDEAPTTTVAAPDDANGGGSDDNGASDTTAAPMDEGDPSGEDDGGDQPITPEVGEMGSFTVNGTEFAVTFLNRCIPFGGEESDQIDLQPVAQGQGAILHLYGTADSVEVSVDGSTVEEIGGSIAFTATPFGDGEIQESTISGDRWTGSATLIDIMGAVDPVEVTWDVMIPDEIVDCSL